MQQETSVSFFDLLGLDPDAPWDQGRFEALLKAKQSEWSRHKVQGVGKKKAEAEEAYRLIPSIKTELSDPAKRSAHAERARNSRAQDRRRKAKELEDRVRICSARGYLLEAEEAAFLKEYSPILGEAAVRQYWATLSIKHHDPSNERQALPIDSSLAAEIDRNVRRLGARTLYEFLLNDGRPIAEREPTPNLLAAAERVYRDTTTQANKSDELTLRATVAGQAMRCFASEEQRARYDATLQESRFSDLLSKADKAAKIATELTAPQVQLLLEEAGRAGLDPEETRTRIIAHAKKAVWSIEVPNVSTQRWCGCGELNSVDAERCRTCGERLTVVCPGCSHEMPSAAAACTSCGFPIGRRFRVRDLINETRELLEAGSVREARHSLADATAQWPSTGRDELSKDLESLNKDTTAALNELEQAVHAVHALVASKTFYAARAWLLSLARVDRDDPQIAGLRSQIDNAITDVERQIHALKNRQVTDDDAAIACLRILDVCSDCEAALRVLARHPPASPPHVQATVQGHLVSVMWSRSTSAEVRYVVVRKRKVRPQNPNDGELVATVEDVRCQDASPEIGVDLHYAVFADRRGVTSRTAAQLEAPLIVLGEVADLHAQIGDGEVRLDWVPPPNVQRVFATRTSARAGSQEEGRRIESIDTRQLIDRSAINEREYRYTVQCEFITTDGRTLFSRGTDIVATPQKRPATVEPLVILPIDMASGRALRVSWQPPSKGDVWILVTADRPVCAGQGIPGRELSRHGETLVSSGSSIDVPWQDGGVRYYTPVVVLGETAYIGSTHRYVHVEDVRRLEPQNLGDRVRLSWEWPTACTEVRLNTSSTGWPLDESGNLETHATSTAVAKAEYDRHGHYDLRPSINGDLYVVVQAVTRAGDEQIIAPGTRRCVRLCSLVRLEYALRPRSWFRRSIELAISTDRATDLPPFRVVRKRGQLPQDRDDGDCVLRQAGTTSVKRQLRLPLTETQADGRAFARLFLESDQDYEWITVFHPDREKLRI